MEGEPLARGARHIGRLLAEERDLFAGVVEVEGHLAAEPRRRPPPEGGCWIEIDLLTLSAARRTVRAEGAVRVGVPPPPGGVADACTLGAGTRVRVPAVLSSPRSFANPGALDYAAWLASRGISATGRARSARLVQVVRPAPLLRRAVTWARGSVLRAIDLSFAPNGGPAAAGIAKALVLGVREDVPREAESALQAAGTSHLLAVSGFNVAVLAGCVWGAVRRLAVPIEVRTLAVAATLAGYLALTGREPSVERAVAGALLYLAGRSLGRRPRPVGTVAAVVFLLSAPRPAVVHDASFELTFVAAAALCAWAGPVARALPGPRWLASALAVNGVALALTTPLTAYLFNRVTPGALLANLGASPLMAFALVASLAAPAARLVGGVLGWIGVSFVAGLAPVEVLGWAASWAIEGALQISRSIAAVPGMTWSCVTPRALLCAASLAAAAASGAAVRKTRARRIIAAMACVSGLICALPGEGGPWVSWLRNAPEPPPRALRVTALDVGQGSATLLETPGGGRILVDAGGYSSRSFDVGERVVARALMSMGIRRVDAVVVTHADVDHAGGVPAVLRMFVGREIWISSCDHARGSLHRALAAALDNGRVVRVLKAGGRFTFAGVLVEILHPPRGAEDLRDNDRSLVLRVSAGGRAAILPGDIESTAEALVAAAAAPSDVLLVPHHGSRTSSSDVFLRAARPAWGIISCGSANRWGHPHPEAVARLRRAGVRLLRTDRDGAVRIDLDAGVEAPAGARVERFAGRWLPVAGAEKGSGEETDGVRDE